MPTLHLIHSENGLLKALDLAATEDFLLILNQDLIHVMKTLDIGHWACLTLNHEDHRDTHRQAITVDDMVTLSMQYKPILTWR